MVKNLDILSGKMTDRKSVYSMESLRESLKGFPMAKAMEHLRAREKESGKVHVLEKEMDQQLVEVKGLRRGSDLGYL
jgi:hypothetical protein